MEILIFIAGTILGSSLVFLILKNIQNRQSATYSNEKLMAEQNFVRQKYELEKENSVLTDRYSLLLNEREELLLKLEAFRAEVAVQSQKLARNEAEYNHLQEKLDTQKKDLELLQQKFTSEFEHIAAKILKQNTSDFSVANQKSMTDILSPLKEKIQLFEKKVEDTYEKGLKDQTDLKAELKKLHDLNLKISEEANNLTRALKGDVKKQGNWGELILERILERSGLTEGREYTRQQSVVSGNGQRFQPDVVINLPDEKHLVIDSKVSLVAYERLVNSDNERDRLLFVKEHLQSIRSHIRILSDKHYQHSTGFNSPDFVLLFVPIESSFSIAVQEDQELFGYAWDNKVVIVSPSTLLATLRTIASIWQQENQTRNAIEIAKQSGALYDKFVSFVEDLTSLGKSIEATRKNYDQAMNKLSEGSGNLVRRAENIRKLGAKTTKKLSPEILDDANE